MPTPYSPSIHFSIAHISPKYSAKERHYRILLPRSYQTSGERYSVIYYFHGHSDRYTVEKDDDGTDTIPKMADWVSKHDAIVVCVDGYVASDYTGFYGASPWDLMESGGDHDFGPYFLKLLNHIDADAPRLLPLPKSDRLRLPPGREVHLPVCIHNPRAEALTDVTVALSSDYPTVTFLSNSAAIPRIEPGGVADLTSGFVVKFTAGAGDFAPTRLNLKLTYDGRHEALEDIDLLVTPDRLSRPRLTRSWTEEQSLCRSSGRKGIKAAGVQFREPRRAREMVTANWRPARRPPSGFNWIRV